MWGMWQQLDKQKEIVLGHRAGAPQHGWNTHQLNLKTLHSCILIVNDVYVQLKSSS